MVVLVTAAGFVSWSSPHSSSHYTEEGISMEELELRQAMEMWILIERNRHQFQTYRVTAPQRKWVPESKVPTSLELLVVEV